MHLSPVNFYQGALSPYNREEGSSPLPHLPPVSLEVEEEKNNVKSASGFEILKSLATIREASEKQFLTNFTKNNPLQIQFVEDPHTFSRPWEAVIRHMDLDFAIDFDKKQITGKVILNIENMSGTEYLHLDTKKLEILSVKDEKGVSLPFQLGDVKEWLGQDLAIQIPQERGEKYKIFIEYRTSPEAEGLHWYTNDEDKLLYSHSQPIYTRSWLPCQDSSQVRMTYTATFRTNSTLCAMMSCNNNSREKKNSNHDLLSMNLPIPSYLMAFCVGNLQYLSIGPKTGVYAHPNIVKAAYEEFNNLENVLESVEEILGPYQWDRYDILFLPIDFPATATENPMISFFSNMVIAGDKSRFNVVLHELAHSYSGNLVTAATWENLWLNEGITTWIELFFAEKIISKDYADMIAKTYYHSLQEELSEEGALNTQLKMKLDGKNPRDSFTAIPYYKGYFFLKALEIYFQRDRLLNFLKQYFEEFKFQSMTTEKFESYLLDKLFLGDKDLAEQLKVKEWLYASGLPLNCPQVESTLITQIDHIYSQWQLEGSSQHLIEKMQFFTPQQWIYFIQKLRDATPDQLKQLDEQFNFKQDKRLHIREQWLSQAVDCKYTEIYPEVKEFVLLVKKPHLVQKFLNKLIKTEEGKIVAKEIYEEGKSTFRARSRTVADKIIQSINGTC